MSCACLEAAVMSIIGCDGRSGENYVVNRTEVYGERVVFEDRYNAPITEITTFYILISTSTPAGKFKFVNASTVLGVGS